MESRVPTSERVSDGVTLERTASGGYAVKWSGQFIGWIHATVGDRWNAYLRPIKDCEPEITLGRFRRDDAVRRIAVAAGGSEQNPPLDSDPADRGHRP
jgi:hypothetical protein